MIGETTGEQLDDGFCALEEGVAETEVKVGVEKSLTGRWCPGRDELGRFKTGTTKRGQWNTLQVLGQYAWKMTW